MLGFRRKSDIRTNRWELTEAKPAAITLFANGRSILQRFASHRIKPCLRTLEFQLRQRQI